MTVKWTMRNGWGTTALGLNYAISPSSIYVDEIICSTEAVARKLDSKHNSSTQSRCEQCSQNSKTPRPNLSHAQRPALKEIWNYNTIVILPVDKRNATVVIDNDFNEGLTIG